MNITAESIVAATATFMDQMRIAEVKRKGYSVIRPLDMCSDDDQRIVMTAMKRALEAAKEAKSDGVAGLQ